MENEMICICCGEMWYEWAKDEYCLKCGGRLIPYKIKKEENDE